jgi:hypothetical protein
VNEGCGRIFGVDAMAMKCAEGTDLQLAGTTHTCITTFAPAVVATLHAYHLSRFELNISVSWTLYVKSNSFAITLSS